VHAADAFGAADAYVRPIERMTSLVQFLASQIINSIVKKGFFAGEYVLFCDYMPRAAFLYETGAVLGHAFRDRLTTFAQLFSAPGHRAERNFALMRRCHSASRLNSLDAPPSDFAELYFAPEATRLIGVRRNAGLTDASDWLDMHKVANQKLRVADIFTQLQMAPSHGIGFGSRYPDLTAQLLTTDIDPAEYQRFRAAGLAVPPTPPKNKTMNERQEMALTLIRPYVQHARPDLVAALGL
jgi:hypothetical protein